MKNFVAFELPEISPAARPEFADGPSCRAWLENVPLANVSAAQHQLLLQVEEFNRHGAPARARLEALEAVREAVHFVQVEQAKRFTQRALPMLPSETALFEDTLELWEQMRLGYLRCLQEGGAVLRPQAALLCQRALALSGLRMYHRYRGYRLVPPADWRALHQVYARAEALGVADKAVKDYLNRDVYDASPRIAYVRAVLMGLCNPNELGPRQLAFVSFLLERWADKVDVGKAPHKDEDDLPPIFVDLAGERGAERGEPQGAQLRYFGVRRLAKSLRNRVALLRKGESPARLALGEDCVQPSCEQLLVFLYRQWCLAKQPRATERKRVTDVAQACNDMGAIHYYISGHVFKQPGEAKELTAAQRDQIVAFGRVSTREDDDYSVVHGYLLEHWQIEDESSQGLKLVRRAGNPGKRYTHGQLIGVRPADSKNFVLGQVRWLMQNDAGDLYCGVRLLPGLPAATAVRPTGLNVTGAKYVQALSLTGVSALNAPPSVVVPAGWFKPKRVVEVYVEGHIRVRFTGVLDRGSDYERCGYEMVS
jgi:hypothetical protein